MLVFSFEWMIFLSSCVFASCVYLCMAEYRDVLVGHCLGVLLAPPVGPPTAPPCALSGPFGTDPKPSSSSPSSGLSSITNAHQLYEMHLTEIFTSALKSSGSSASALGAVSDLSSSSTLGGASTSSSMPGPSSSSGSAFETFGLASRLRGIWLLASTSFCIREKMLCCASRPWYCVRVVGAFFRLVFVGIFHCDLWSFPVLFWGFCGVWRIESCGLSLYTCT